MGETSPVRGRGRGRGENVSDRSVVSGDQGLTKPRA